MTLVMKAETSPTLTAGAFNVTFGNYQKVVNAHVMFDDPGITDYVFMAVVTKTTNVVTVTVKKAQISVTNTYGAAITTDVSGKTFVVVADCI